MNVEYKSGGLEYVSLTYLDSKDDVAQKLISSGFLLAEKRREKRLAKLVSDYMKAQEKAKSSRVSLGNKEKAKFSGVSLGNKEKAKMGKFRQTRPGV